MICKLCLSESIAMDVDGLEQMINTVFHEQVILTRQEVRHICTACRDKVKTFYEFHETVLENQKMQPEFLEQDSPQKPEVRKKRKTVPEKSKAVCEICGDFCASQSALNVHIRNLHSEESVKLKPCPICSKMIKDCSISLEYHMRQNHEQTRIKCPQCDATAKDDDALAKHTLRVHAGGTHCCQYCAKKFKSRNNLVEHEATHTGIALYKCEFCLPANVEFKSNGNYLGHKRKNHPAEYQKQKLENQAKKYLDISSS